MDEIKKESWNKTRIFAALFLVLLLAVGGYFFKTRVLDAKSISFSNPFKSIKGVSSKEESKNRGKDMNIDIQKDVEKKLENLKQEVFGLNILEVASSSPQIQKIINDIKSLEQYPINQAKEICKQICGL